VHVDACGDVPSMSTMVVCSLDGIRLRCFLVGGVMDFQTAEGKVLFLHSGEFNHSIRIEWSRVSK
jgi:hypothetical protein